MTTRVLIVDDHPVIRSGLRRVIDAESDIQTVGEAGDADRAVFEAIENKPDVVVLDVMMPNKTGIEGLPALLQAVPDAKVLGLSMQDDPRYVREAFDAGASGYVLKGAADNEVVGALTSCRSSTWGARRSLSAMRSPKACSTRSRVKAEHADG
jgi:two-component system, NarL family, response regulator NreC